jgi:hypothetical protein
MYDLDIIEEIESGVDFWSKRYSDARLGPGTFVHFKEKHGESFFAAETFEQFANVMRVMLYQRYAYGWYPNKPIDMPKAPYTKEELEAVPEKLARHAQSDMRAYKRELRNAQDNNYNIQLIEFALSDHELAPYAAICFMERREDHQYEHWSLEKACNPDKVEEATDKYLARQKKKAA